MKKVIIPLLIAFLTSVSVPVFAEGMKATKDECLLASKDCKDQVDSIQQKMKKLQTEIKKGKKVYTTDELKELEKKLKETNDFLDLLNKR